MRLHEYEAADIFQRQGIPVPERDLASNPDEVQKISEKIGFPVVLKGQVLVGGRGIAGGIKTAQNPEEASRYSTELFASEIKGLPVRSILVVKKVEVEKELYVGITVDGYIGKPVVLVSTEGGMNIEDVARRSPEKIARLHVDIGHGLFPYEARGILVNLGLASKELLAVADILVKLYRVFSNHNALIAEINPLAVLIGGGATAIDAVLDIDDSALFRLGDLLPPDVQRVENPIELKGREIGVTYVDMDGDIGIISSGAGLGMATMDIIAQRLRPANFLETGGGMTEALMYSVMELMMTKEGLRGIFLNIYGGINPIHLGAQGVVRFLNEHNIQIPVVAKALGNRQEETWDILRSGGVHVVTDAATEKAVERLIELLEN